MAEDDNNVSGGPSSESSQDKSKKTEPELNQLFRPSTNTLIRVLIVLPVLLAGLAGYAGWVAVQSPYVTGVGNSVVQPVHFSHKHHVSGAGLDCRYCHFSVEDSSSAGMPSTQVCMTCHSQLFSDSPLLKVVRESYESGEPIRWNRVHNLQDHAFFNHSIHIAKGVSCVSCHGNVEQMVLIKKAEPLTMSWCLDCHRNPAPNLRPKEEVFDFFHHTEISPEEKRSLLLDYNITPERLEHCYICHR